MLKREIAREPVFKVAFDMIETGHALSLSKPNVYGLIQRGVLKTFLVGNKRLATADAIRECARALEAEGGALPSERPNNRHRPATVDAA